MSTITQGNLSTFREQLKPGAILLYVNLLLRIYNDIVRKSHEHRLITKDAYVATNTIFKFYTCVCVFTPQAIKNHSHEMKPE